MTLAVAAMVAASAMTATTAVAAPISASGTPADVGASDCFVAGIANSVRCDSIERPLDPVHPEHGRITVRYVVVPALARRKLADPVFFLAGGPGQSAVAVAGQVMPALARLGNRRDIVFVDQRGTGGSAPLICKDPDDATLAEQSEPDRQFRVAMDCKAELVKLPYIGSEGGLRFFTTSVAVQDLDAVRRRLGAERIDLIGGSYGTRVALEYLRQFPAAVRRTVLDGAAPPDMALPASFSTDGQAAFDKLAVACAAEPACASAHPTLHARFSALLQGLPREVSAVQPLTGRPERFTLTRAMLLDAVRGALYVPALAAALPAAIDAAAHDDFAGLLGLGATLRARDRSDIAAGMHFSVVCAEDTPRLAATDASSTSGASGARADLPGPDFGDAFARRYREICAGWPRGAVPPGFYTVVRSESPVLVLSGGLDPVTPPRHGARVADALGPLARHVVVANAGHGVMSIGCMRDVVYRFIDAASDRDALAVDAGCAAQVPRPPAFEPVGAAIAGAVRPAQSADPARR